MSARFALLALLSEGPKSSLQLREELEARTGGAWPLNVGQVYTTLQCLERDALVESGDAGPAGPQKGFRITADGERELAGWLRTPPDLASPLQDELAAKILVALRVPGTDVHEVVQAHRRSLVELMQPTRTAFDPQPPPREQGMNQVHCWRAFGWTLLRHGGYAISCSLSSLPFLGTVSCEEELELFSIRQIRDRSDGRIPFTVTVTMPGHP